MIGVYDCFLILWLRLWLFHRSIALSCHLGCLLTIVIHMLDFSIGKRNVQSSQIIHNLCQCGKIRCGIIRNIQIQIRIQHGNRLFRSSIGIGGICFCIGSVSDIQKCISVNRDHTYLTGIIVYTYNDHGITILCRQIRSLTTGINSKQYIGFVPCHLWCFRIHRNRLTLQLRLLDLVQSGRNLSVDIQSANKQQKYNNFKHKQYFFLFSWFSHTLLSPYLNMHSYLQIP